MLTFFVIIIIGIILIVALLSKSLSPHTVWGYLFSFSILNILLRYIFIDLGIGIDIINPWKSILQNLTIEQLEFGAAYYLSIIIILSIGFLLWSPTKCISPWLFRSIQEIRIDYTSAVYLFFIYTVIAGGALLYFIYKHSGSGFDDIQNFVSYRGVSDDLDSYQADGPVRFMINMGSLSGLMSYCLLCDNRLRQRGLGLKLKIIIGFSIFISVVMAMFSQSRSGFAFALINYLFVYRIVVGRWWSVKRIGVIVLSICVVYEFMTINRNGNGIESVEDGFNLGRITTLFVMNNGGVDISKTVLIIDKYKLSEDYLLGETLLGIFWSYIPRTIWKSKPVNLDTRIGFEVYGGNSYGSGAVPPGLPAELFINFGHIGVVVGILILGMVARGLHNDYLKNRGKFLYPVYYVTCTCHLLYGFMASGFTSTLMGFVSNYIVLYITVKYFMKAEVTKI